MAELAPVTYQNVQPVTGFIVIPANAGDVNVYNDDIANVLLVSNSPTPVLSNSIPVQPLTNAKFTGAKRHWYASALPGQSVAQMTVSTAELSPSPAQISAQISALGLAKDTSVNAPAYQPVSLTNPGLLAKDSSVTPLAKDATVTGVAKSTDITTLGGGKSLANVNTTLGVPAQTADVGALHAAGHTIANEISTTGAPGLKFRTQLATGSNTPIPAGGGLVTLLTTTAVTTPAFEIAFQVDYTTTNGTVPFIKLICTWTSQSGLFVANRNYMVPIGGVGVPYAVYLIGPALGDNLEVSVTSFEPAGTGQAASASFDINQISHYINSDIFDSAQITTVPGIAAPGGLLQAGIILATNPTLAASASTTRLVPASNAQCDINIYIPASTGGNINVIISDPGVFVGTPIYGLGNGATFYFHQQSNTIAPSANNDTFQMPNGPALLTIVNNSGSASVSPIITITENRQAAA